MKSQKNKNVPYKGMNRDNHPSELSQESYTFALNSHFEDGNNQGAQHKNEPSNIKCTSFLSDYKVIGHKYHLNKDVVYFFLTNSKTGCSEIGYVPVVNFENYQDIVEESCGCNITAVLEDGLENQVFNDTCTYTTIISDFCRITNTCTGCLNFDIDSPIYESNIEIKEELRGTRIYFTDNNNPPRYIDLDDLQKYTQTEDDCDGTVTENCLDCDKMRVFPLYTPACSTVESLSFGGNLPQGNYELLFAYSDQQGDPLTNYFAVTNIIPIFDENNRIQSQALLGEETSKSIQIKLSDLDSRYQYYTIVVAHRSGLNAQMSYYRQPTLRIGITDYTLATLDITNQVSQQELFDFRTTYEKTKGLVAGNGYLFQYGLTAKKEINLQPIANLLGGLAQWGTHIANEDLYTSGANVAEYSTYMRDEIQPFSIRFNLKGGYTTAVYPLIPKHPTDFEKEKVGNGTFANNTSTDSIEEIATYCEPTDRNERWQFHNTATEEGECSLPSNIEENSYTESTEEFCTTTSLTPSPTITSGIITVDSETSLVEYINQFKDDIITGTLDGFTAIATVLANPQNYDGSCTPDFQGDCGTPVISGDGEMFAEAVQPLSETITEKAIDNYQRLSPPVTCNIFFPVSAEYAGEVDADGDGLVQEPDEPFGNTYFGGGDKFSVFKRPSRLSAINYQTAIDVPQHFDPALDTSVFLVHEGTKKDVDDILSTIDAQAEGTVVNETNPIFLDKIAKNAVWMKLNFDESDKKILDISSSSFQINDDLVTQDRYRVSIYKETNGQLVFDSSFIVDDSTTVNNPVTILTLEASDFPTSFGENIAYIAIDGPVLKAPKGLSRFINVVPRGCLNFSKRDVEFDKEIEFRSLTFSKQIKYVSDCTYTYPILGECDTIPSKYGKFAHWESTVKYPCNQELFDSTNLTIKPADIPLDYRTEFERMYTNSGAVDVAGNYVLNDNADFRDKAIRHYKFPCAKTAPFMGTFTDYKGINAKTFIYPIGFKLDAEVVRSFLDIAVTSGLLSQEDRDNIQSYEIFKGSRINNKTIVAKGLLYDMSNYNEDGDTIYYSNYPLNSLELDPLTNTRVPFAGTGNFLYSFLSPETSFEQPTLGTELKLEGYQFGSGFKLVDEVEDYPTVTVLGDKAFRIATLIATTEVGLDIALSALNYGIDGLSAGTPIGLVGSIGLSVAAIAVLTQSVFKIGRLRQEWITTFRNLGKPSNLAYTETSVVNYDRLLTNDSLDDDLRSISVSTYLDEGRYNVTDEKLASPAQYKINNFKREDSVFLSLGKATYKYDYPQKVQGFDSGLRSSRRLYYGTGRSPQLPIQSVSPYVSMKLYRPALFGQIDSILWDHTASCINIDSDSECETVFGGDTYISRFSVKRKMPIFTTNAFGLAPFTPFKHSDYFNINPENISGRYYLDYLLTDSELTFGNIVFPTDRSNFNLITNDSAFKDGFYVEPPSKFLTYSYGIPNFLVESQINLNYRYNQRAIEDRFYPHVPDVLDWTQQKNVSINEPNFFNYNRIYSLNNNKIVYRTLPIDYSEDLENRIGNEQNSVIYSQQDKSETSKNDPWLNYRALDYTQFESRFGRLVSMDPIESEQILARFENGFTIFGAIDTIRDRLTPETETLGTGGIFNGRPITFNNTDLGYAGTQHRALVSTQFGHTWVDAKRGKVFLVGPNAKGLQELTTGMEKWFKKHLPFKILRDLPEIDIDNAFKSVGILLGWDERNKRIFLVKRDYRAIQAVSMSNGVIYDSNTNQPVELTNTDYFEDCSFTIAFSPQNQSWISYYSFKPDYFISLLNYFSTGINNSNNISEIGLWNHLPLISSHQVFYGKLYPWTIEYALKTEGVHSMLSDVDYWMTVKKWYTDYDFSDIVGSGFNKAYLYNDFQNSGELRLKVEDKNDYSQQLTYPKQNSDSTEILQTEINGKYSFNYFFNYLNNEGSRLPSFSNDCNEINKLINPVAFDYRPTMKDRLRGDWFFVRLTQDNESRYAMSFRLGEDERIFYND